MPVGERLTPGVDVLRVGPGDHQIPDARLIAVPAEHDVRSVGDPAQADEPVPGLRGQFGGGRIVGSDEQRLLTGEMVG